MVAAALIFHRTLFRHRPSAYRFYWSTPVHLSPHNPRVVFVGGNRLFRSMDRGDTWTATPDLTKQIDRSTLPIMGVPGKDPMASKHDGYSGYGYIVTVAKSPKVRHTVGRN